MLKKPGVWIAIGIVIFLAVLVSGTIGQGKVRVEACVAFRGRTECRTAAGPTEEQALRTAVENACGMLASGMTDSMACGSTPPQSVRRLD